MRSKFRQPFAITNSQKQEHQRAKIIRLLETFSRKVETPNRQNRSAGGGGGKNGLAASAGVLPQDELRRHPRRLFPHTHRVREPVSLAFPAACPSMTCWQEIGHRPNRSLARRAIAKMGGEPSRGGRGGVQLFFFPTLCVLPAVTRQRALVVPSSQPSPKANHQRKRPSPLRLLPAHAPLPRAGRPD